MRDPDPTFACDDCGRWWPDNEDHRFEVDGDTLCPDCYDPDEDGAADDDDDDDDDDDSASVPSTYRPQARPHSTIRRDHTDTTIHSALVEISMDDIVRAWVSDFSIERTRDQ